MQASNKPNRKPAFARATELTQSAPVCNDGHPMTPRGAKYWDSGAIPLIAPEMLGDIIATLADIAIVIDQTGLVLSVLANPVHGTYSNLSHWENRNVRTILCSESIPKFDRQLKAFLEGETMSKPMQINHSDDHIDWGFPVNYTMHTIGPDGSILMLGRDLRPISEMQQQLVKAQIALERDYEQQREYDTRFRVLMESSRDALAFVSLGSGRITEINGVAARLLGRERADLVGAAFAQEFDGRRRGELMESLGAAAMADGPASITLQSNKGRRTIRLTPTMFRASGERMVLCRLESGEGKSAPVEELIQHLKGLYESGADAIVFTDADGIIVSLNEAFLELTDSANAQKVKGQSLSDYLQRGMVDLRVLLENAARTGQIRLYSTKLSGEFGSPRMVEISATYLADAAKPSYAFVLRDSSRADAVRASAAPAGEDNVKSVMELVGSATLKEIVAETTDVVERMCIETAIELTSNNRVAAAEMLGLSRQSLYVKLRKYGLVSKGE